MALAAAVTGNLIVAAVATLVTSAASAISKASLDASMHAGRPCQRSRGPRRSAGRSRCFQLAWVLGGALGVLVYTELWVGFTAISSILIPGLAQTVVSFRGNSLIPGFGGNRPVLAEPEAAQRWCTNETRTGDPGGVGGSRRGLRGLAVGP